MAYDMRGGTSGMMGMGGIGLGGPMSGYYSGNNMAVSLLAQSKSNKELKIKLFNYYFLIYLVFIS